MKDNKLIAEFMGYKVVDKPKVVNGENFFEYIDENNNYTYCNSLLKYHTSWDWLMPVMEKISDIKSWSLNGTLEWLSESQDRDGLYDKEDIFQAVVEFINQYNK
tara:strand:+ start:116 stop:427 length:312 start_codon:yes stop_codon:yes gene_type:complete